MNDREGAITITRAFVDAIEEETATLLVGDRTARVPAAILPDGVSEGDWVEVRIKAIPESAEGPETQKQRQRLTDDDDGGDLKL